MTLKLRTQLLLALLPVLLIPVLLLAILQYQQQRQTLVAQITQDMQATLGRYETQFHQQIHQARKDLDLLSNSHLLRQYFLIPDKETRFQMLFRSLLELFKGFQRSEPVYREIRLLDDNGNEEVRFADPRLVNHFENESHRPWFGHLQQDRTATQVEVVEHPDFGEPVLLVGKSIPLSSYADWNGRARINHSGYLVLSISLQELYASLDRQVIGSGGFLVILDQAGQPLHLPQRAQAFGGHLPALFRQTRTSPGQLQTVDDQGQTFLVQRHPLFGGYDLYAVWPEAETHALVHEIASQLTFLLALVALAVTAVMVLLVHRLVELPIRRLQQLSQQLANRQEANDHAPLDFSAFTRKDEIGELANSFRTMAEQLSLSHKKLQRYAFFDNLTGLYNRTMFHDRLTQAIANAERHQQHLAVLFIDIDGFKEVNDTLGHEHGDMVLREIAARLSRFVRESDVLAMGDGQPDPDLAGLARFGGDEFSLVITELQQTHDAGQVAERILALMAQPFLLQKQMFHLGASIGIALFPEDGREAAALLKNADMAMYHAKAQGKNRFEYFDPATTQSAALRHQALNELREAMELGQFCLHYQPEVDVHSGEITGCEALLRWQHPVRGLLLPDDFIPLAEESGLIVKLGRWVLEEACRQNRQWQQQGCKAIRVAVNFSTVQFNREPDIAGLIRQTLTDTGLAPCHLEVEITETGIMQSHHVSKERLLAIKHTGVSIAMDDFGTGYSSLASLRDFPLDRIKVDRSFISAIGTSEAGSTIINAILAMARELKLQVVAEGVETNLQRDHLCAQDCALIQGMLISHPLPPDEMERLLQQAANDCEAESCRDIR